VSDAHSPLSFPSAWHANSTFLQIAITISESATHSQAQRRPRKAQRTRTPLLQPAIRLLHPIFHISPEKAATRAIGRRSRRAGLLRRHICSAPDSPVDERRVIALTIRTRNARTDKRRTTRSWGAVLRSEHPTSQQQELGFDTTEEHKERHVVS